MASRRERRLQRRQKSRKSAPVEAPAPTKPKRGLLHTIYHDHYKILLYIPFILLLLALLQIGLQMAATGDFLHKGVSLRGGLIVTVPVANTTVTIGEVEQQLQQAFPDTELVVRGLSEFGQLRGITIQVASDTENETILRSIENSIIQQLTPLIPDIKQTYSVEVIGPSLGASFFRQTMTAVLIAFMLMGLIIFYYFGENRKAKAAATLISLAAYLLFRGRASTWHTTLLLLFGASLVYIYVKYSPPSAAVILAAFSDIVMTLAVVNLLGIKIGTAGIAAFLMLIGYSVDTDILLSTRVLKQRKGTVYESVVSSLKTGMLMSLTSFAAALVGFLVSQSDTIKQIMLIILIGLLADIINTWLQNAGILRIYGEKRRGAQ